jgi:hypothetical protein
MSAANRDLTFAGVIVVAPGVFRRTEHHEAAALVTDEQKTALDALHLPRIDLADRVLAVNPGGCVGESRAGRSHTPTPPASRSASPIPADAGLPGIVADLPGRWECVPDGAVMHGSVDAGGGRGDPVADE